MRMMVRLTEKFGGESDTLKVIKEVMDTNLGNNIFIESKVSLS